MQYCSYVSALVGVIIKEKLISCLKICPLYRDLLVRNSPGSLWKYSLLGCLPSQEKVGEFTNLLKLRGKGICLKIKLSKEHDDKGSK